MNLHRCLVAFVALCFIVPAHAATPPVIVLVSGEDEYHSAETLPAFAKSLEADHHFKTVYLERQSKPDTIAGLDALERADLLILFARRMTLPDDQLKAFQKYFESGKPVIGLRTASHAFQTWLVFDQQVLGGNYQNHYGNNLLPLIVVQPPARQHPILRGLPDSFASAGSLYRNSGLQTNTTPLLTGIIRDENMDKLEPVAWTHDYKGARVFYTSLGHPDDFKDAAFRRLLINAIYWALNKPAPETVK
jgi:type 1 glutamine amidotransferase